MNDLNAEIQNHILINGPKGEKCQKECPGYEMLGMMLAGLLAQIYDLDDSTQFVSLVDKDALPAELQAMDDGQGPTFLVGKMLFTDECAVLFVHYFHEATRTLYMANRAMLEALLAEGFFPEEGMPPMPFSKKTQSPGWMDSLLDGGFPFQR